MTRVQLVLKYVVFYKMSHNSFKTCLKLKRTHQLRAGRLTEQLEIAHVKCFKIAWLSITEIPSREYPLTNQIKMLQITLKMAAKLDTSVNESFSKPSKILRTNNPQTDSRWRQGKTGESHKSRSKSDIILIKPDTGSSQIFINFRFQLTFRTTKNTKNI